MSETIELTGVEKALLDPKSPLYMKKTLLLSLCNTEGEEGDATIAKILSYAMNSQVDEKMKENYEELIKMIEALKQGPLKVGTYINECSLAGTARGLVKLQNGDQAYCVITDKELAKELKAGDTVLTDAQGLSILFRDAPSDDIGPEAKIERVISDTAIEISMGGQGESAIFHSSYKLSEQLKSGEATPGNKAIVCPTKRIAFSVVPKSDKFSNFQFLVNEEVPDVIVERDIGAPPKFINEITKHVFREMTDPKIARKYKLRPSIMQLLSGVSGTGKTLGINALWHNLYNVMSEVTGTPKEELPPRVLKLKASKVLSKWFGESDKLIDRFFDEAEALASEKYELNGGTFNLPVLIICEEIDSIARERGTSSTGDIHDRLMSTLLQRLDSTNQQMSKQLMVVVCTTNVPQLVDPAIFRRVGGRIEHFYRLERDGFASIINKHLSDLPFEDSQEKVERDLAEWLYNTEQTERVSLVYEGKAAPDKRYRQDFLTGGLIDRCVQQATAKAADAEYRKVKGFKGLNFEVLMNSLDAQISSIVEQLKPQNVHNYLSVPDGVRVTDVIRA